MKADNYHFVTHDFVLSNTSLDELVIELKSWKEIVVKFPVTIQSDKGPEVAGNDVLNMSSSRS